MSCRRAFEVDLAQLLHGGSGPEWTAFRDHYPHCAACASEVRAWTEVHLALAERPDAHPAPERLLALAERTARMPAAERTALETHVAACRTCRDEVSTLRSLDLGGLLATPTPRGWNDVPDSGLPGWFRTLQQLFRRPAFAYALVLLVLAPLVYTRLGGRSAVEDTFSEQRRSASPPLAARDLGDRPNTQEFDAAHLERAPVPTPPAEDERLRGVAKMKPAQPAVRAEAPAEAFSDVGRSANLPALAAAGPDPQPVRLAPDREVSIARAPAGRDLLLEVPVPAAVTADVELRLVSADGLRELRERLTPRDGVARLRVPAAWLVAGAYRVELRAGGAPQAHGLRVVER